SFTVPAQNALLKILEEPPLNIAFILLTLNKSTFLPTVRSRLSLTQEHYKKQYESMTLTLRTLDLSSMFMWIKAHEKVKKHEAKELIENLFYHAAHVETLALTTAQIEGFDKAFRLIDLNARVQSVLVMILMNFLKEVKRAR
ncbi:MAG: DNA polymerase III subunit delta', partial [Sulfuricurvum sp.]|nr:DNA polymerase III subunit delta' [Sulfuricurvum sp.]